MRLSLAAACRSIAVLCLATVAPVAAATVTNASPTVLELAARQPNLSTFVAAVHSAGLDSTLNGSDAITVLAPTDQAFAKLAPADRDALMSPANREKLRHVLLGHVIKGAFAFHDADAGDVSEGTIETADGTTLTVGKDGRGLTLAGAHLLTADVRAGNGRLTTIDRVLL
jgi:uncharacterized surface protein with fasciclin (FAS1) repeats